MPSALKMPEDFATVAPGKTNRQIAAHYGCGIVIISTWRKLAGVPAARVNHARPMPANFAELAPTMSYAEMSALWRVGSVAITKWCQEAGVTSRARPDKPRKAKPAHASKPARRQLFAPPQSIGALPDSTDAGQAATFLRRIYPNVYRASVLDKAERRAKGVPGDGRDYFFVGGRGLLPANDMIELARSKGFAA